MKLNGNHLHIITAYAPTLVHSQKHPEDRESFYKDLEQFINSIPNRHIIILLGDFNAKLGSSHKTHQNIIGQYGKGETNENGFRLLELVSNFNLKSTNTQYRHKFAHTTTWTTTNKNKTSQNNEPRKNPIRNQIDHIFISHKTFFLVQDSRAYAGTFTDSDHHLVILTTKLNWSKFQKVQPQPKLDITQLQQSPIQKSYAAVLENKLNLLPQNTSTIQNWDLVKTAIIDTANDTLPMQQRNIKHTDPDLTKLQTEQLQLKHKIHQTKQWQQKGKLKTKRNKIFKKIKQRLKELENEKYNKACLEIEQTKNTTTQYHKAIKRTLDKPNKSKLFIEDGDSIITDPSQKAQKIADYFEKQFLSSNMAINQQAPHPMQIPFTTEEIEKAAKNLNNQKSSGPDKIHAEYIKYGPRELHSNIANLFNQIAQTGIFPTDLQEGILIPLQKPGKKKGPTENLRPIILLNIIRKLLATCLLNRISQRVYQTIPKTQAAYQAGRSTTEHIATIKLMIEKATSSSNIELYLVLLDMSKAFDTINRNSLLQDLKKIAYNEEIFLIFILLQNLKLQVRCDQYLSKPFSTNKGIPQGDSLSPILFILYLALSLNKERNNYLQTDHPYARLQKPQQPPHLHDHNYHTPSRNLNIDLQYADDIAYISNSKDEIAMVQNTVPQALLTRNLNINKEKTEQHTISRTGTQTWKTCKYLGSLLDTNKEFSNSKQKATFAMFKFKVLFNNSNLTTKTKLRIFNCFISTIFLYNSETWTTTNTLNRQIDSFQRRLLRKALGIKWPNIISNSQLQRCTEQEPWSTTIKRRRLNWLGHLLRLHEQIPAKQALIHAIQPLRKPPGQPKLTWIKLVQDDLRHTDLDIYDPISWSLARNRKAWRVLVRYAISSSEDGPT